MRTTITITAASVLALLVGCSGSPPPPPPHHERVWAVSVRDLYRSYQSGSTYWTGAHVRVRLDPHTYRVTGAGVEWYVVPTSADPAVTFYGAKPVPDPTRAVTIEGRVRGVIAGDGPTHVAVDGCAVTADR